MKNIAYLCNVFSKRPEQGERLRRDTGLSCERIEKPIERWKLNGYWEMYHEHLRDNQVTIFENLKQ